MLLDTRELRALGALRKVRDEKIIAAIRAGHSHREIARAHGLSEKGVGKIAQAHSVKPVWMTGPFTPEEDRQIRAHYNKAPGAARVLGKMLRRTRYSIIGRAHRLGLSKRTGSGTGPRKRVLNGSAAS